MKFLGLVFITLLLAGCMSGKRYLAPIGINVDKQTIDLASCKALASGAVPMPPPTPTPPSYPTHHSGSILIPNTGLSSYSGTSYQPGAGYAQMGAALGDMFTAIAVQGEQTKIIDACMRQKGYRVEIKKTD